MPQSGPDKESAQQKVPPVPPPTHTPLSVTCVVTRWWKGSEWPKYLERTRRSPRWQSASLPTLKSSKEPPEDTWGGGQEGQQPGGAPPPPGPRAFPRSPSIPRGKEHCSGAPPAPPTQALPFGRDPSGRCGRQKSALVGGQKTHSSAKGKGPGRRGCRGPGAAVGAWWETWLVPAPFATKNWPAGKKATPSLQKQQGQSTFPPTSMRSGETL